MKEFKKSDLKNRMVVEYRNGYRRMVCDNRLMGLNGSGSLHSYNNDLTCNEGGGSDFDIVKVFVKISQFNELELNLFIVWERSEVKEVTMSEVEEKFGCKVKIVKE